MQRNIYGYVPSLAAGAAALALFAIVTTIHVVYVFRYRIWYFLPIIIGGMLEVGGFAAPIISRNEPGAFGPYAVQDLFLLLPPTLFAASIYMTLATLLVYLNATSVALISVRNITKWFVSGDIIALVMQAAGAGVQAAVSTLSNWFGHCHRRNWCSDTFLWRICCGNNGCRPSIEGFEI